MPALNEQEVTEIIRNAAQSIIQKYGIQNVEQFIQALVTIARIESGWDPGASGDKQPSGRFASYGLFQLLDYTDDGRQGRGYGMTVEQRIDPHANAAKAAEYLGAIWADGEQKGQDAATIAERLIREGQVPANPDQAMQRFREVERQTMTEYEAGQGTTAAQVIPWLTTLFQDEPGYTARQKAEDLFYEDPFKAISLWRQETGQEGAVTEAEEARTAYDWALANKLIAELGGDTYEQGRQRILDEMAQKNWTAQQAVSEFNAWMSAALESGRRAETVYGEEMKRKVWTTPTEYYPGTEPGGMSQQMYERYGLGEQYKPSPGIAVETLPNLEQMYGQWHGKMGISPQAPPTQGGWSGQGMGIDAARDFLQRMNLRPGMPQGAPQGAGF